MGVPKEGGGGGKGVLDYTRKDAYWLRKFIFYHKIPQLKTSTDQNPYLLQLRRLQAQIQ